ncbi:MAG: hypothetical protein RJS98_13620 [Rhodospirillaceae bacterium]
MEHPFKYLLFGHDTVEACFYLLPAANCQLDFASLTAKRDSLRSARFREPSVVSIGGKDFLLQPYGSSSGYPLVLTCPEFHVQFGENNNPPFYVKFLSEALWQYGTKGLVEKFLSWSIQAGFHQDKPETLSRVDFSFDYSIPEVDFDNDAVVSLCQKDSLHRMQGKLQTMTFGRGDIVSRIYDKSAEIKEKSQKTWFYDLWEQTENVWRIEWQARKTLLKRFGLKTFEDLEDGQGDSLSYLSEAHDSLRKPTSDTNRSRWPLHQLWHNLLGKIAELPR